MLTHMDLDKYLDQEKQTARHAENVKSLILFTASLLFCLCDREGPQSGGKEPRQAAASQISELRRSYVETTLRFHEFITSHGPCLKNTLAGGLGILKGREKKQIHYKTLTCVKVSLYIKFIRQFSIYYG